MTRYLLAEVAQVAFKSVGDSQALLSIGKGIAMHIAAARNRER